MARLLLGVSGGIAAYKSLEFARLATLAGHGVRVVMTLNAERFTPVDNTLIPHEQRATEATAAPETPAAEKVTAPTVRPDFERVDYCEA